MSNLRLSVIIPTHAPHAGRLRRTLDGLAAQTLPRDQWELLVVDNASPEPVAVDLANGRVVREEALGLTHARLAGYHAARADLLLFVDDDNVLSPTYLDGAVRLFAEQPDLGAAGGKSIPEWEVEPAGWVHEFAGCLALRDLGDEAILTRPTNPLHYPRSAPLGAGMVVRREVLRHYEESLSKGPRLLDRCGQALTSGGDNDIVLVALKAGYSVGYFPSLRLTHLIPEGRTRLEYLSRLNHGILRSWVQVLARHGVCPWRQVPGWTVPLRKGLAYVRHRAWSGPAAYVRWSGACGMYDGLADLARA